jgi:hypothetical protein
VLVTKHMGTAEWTRTLIPDLRPWYIRRFGEVDFMLTQVWFIPK